MCGVQMPTPGLRFSAKKERMSDSWDLRRPAYLDLVGGRLEFIRRRSSTETSVTPIVSSHRRQYPWHECGAQPRHRGKAVRGRRPANLLFLHCDPSATMF